MQKPEKMLLKDLKSGNKEEIIIVPNYDIKNVIKYLTHSSSLIVYIYLMNETFKKIVVPNIDHAKDKYNIEKEDFLNGIKELISKGYLKWFCDKIWILQLP